MEQKTKNRIPLRELAPRRLGLSLALLALIGTISLLRGNAPAMLWIYTHITRPWHGFMSRLCAVFPFSVAELIYALAVFFVLGCLGLGVWRMIRRGRRWLQLYRTLLSLVLTGLVFWAALCLFWSPCYYAPGFAECAALDDGPVEVEELEAVTAYFARLANEYAALVPRDADGVYAVARGEIIDRAAGVFDHAAESFPCLAGPALRPKTILFSRIMSHLNFTGFFFPMTGEANLNVDSPAFMLPSTAAHELAHQRGVAEEQECNFIAVYACMESGYDDYAYAGALLAYIYLGNALNGADYDAWYAIYSTLSDAVRADLAQNNAYWAPFRESPAQKASNAVYDDFLKSNGQELGRQSYGACVNLLAHYYYAAAKEAA